MPPTEDKGGDDLKIILSKPPPDGYLPCDTIVGRIVRSRSILATEAIITLSLYGRTKTNIKIKGKYSRDSRQLVKIGPRAIFKGALHLAEGSNEPLSLPFAVGIPLEPSTCRTSRNCGVSLIPLDQEHPGHHLFPGTFASLEPALSERAMCFVEYYITAHLQSVSSRHSESCEAVHRIIMRHPPDTLLGQPKLKVFEARGHIQSHHLMPGKEHTKLSFRQHMQTFVESSKVPDFHFRIILKAPLAIQLDNPEPFQLTVEVRPQLDRTSDILQDQMPSVVVSDIQMVLKQNTVLIGEGIFGGSATHAYWELVELGLSHAFRQKKSPITISTASEDPSVNIGEPFGLTLHQHGLASNGRILIGGKDISPEFLTYNIGRTYEVGWQVTIIVAGRAHKVKFNSDIRIVAAPCR